MYKKVKPKYSKLFKVK